MAHKIAKLQVQNFRNLQGDVIQFGPKINCIFGSNGNGKTNILEAIHVLLLKKSFRKNTSFPQYLSVDGEKPEIIISSVFENKDERYSLSTRIVQERMEWFQNGQPVKKQPGVALVFVNPSDSYQFVALPAFRRQWFDQHIGIVNPEYKKVLNQYNSALRNRNVLLSKKPSHYQEQLDALEPLMADYAYKLVQWRKHFLGELAPFCKKAFENVFSEEHDLGLGLETCYPTQKPEEIVRELREQRVKDELIGHTRKGVHKDDYVLHFDGFNAFEFCSLGQQKMSYLSLLFAYIELFRYKFMSFPIVLIDDVSGELDSQRWRRLVHFLEQSEFQVLITTANEKFKEELDRIQDANKIFVSAGAIS